MSGPAFLTETRERFLKAILAQLPIERIRELYLFPPIKQGGVESGVAVVAAWPEGASGIGGAEAGAPLPPAVTGTAVPQAAEEPQDVQTTEQGLIVPVEEPPTVALEEVTGAVAETNGCPVPVAAGEAVGETAAPAGETADEPSDEPAGEAVAETADEPAGETADADAPRAADEVSGGVESGTSGARRPAPDEKYTVYSARYRHVLKGPDRGKWEANVVAEADAPLISIETVVRGVQRRAGDVEGPDHMSSADVRAALRLPAAGSDAA